MIDFLLPVLLAAVGLALVAGPLGCFVLWRRMIYFGDTISHAALLGVALALAVDLPVLSGVIVVSLAIAAMIVGQREGGLHTDTLLGVASHSALALGLVAVALLDGVRVDLMRYLVGDILSVTWADVVVIWAGGGLAVALVMWRWRGLLLASLNRDMALSHSVVPRREGWIFTLALAVFVAVAIKVVGALLVTALLIIPASAARLLADSPERMAAYASVLGAVAAVAGIYGSFRFDTPTGPSIVVAALGVLVVSGFGQKLRLRLQRIGS